MLRVQFERKGSKVRAIILNQPYYDNKFNPDLIHRYFGGLKINRFYIGSWICPAIELSGLCLKKRPNDSNEIEWYDFRRIDDAKEFILGVSNCIKIYNDHYFRSKETVIAE